LLPSPRAPALSHYTQINALGFTMARVA
jgi:hypothetical protein